MAPARRLTFLVPIVAFTLACAVVTGSVLWITGNNMDQRIWAIISYFMVLSMLLHWWQERALDSDPGGSIRRYLAGLSIKMLLSLLLLTVLLMTQPPGDRLVIALVFILLYLAYLGFSTARLAMLIRRSR